MKQTVIGGMAAALALAIAPLAHSHAFLDHAEPAVGSTVHAAPTRIALWFTQELEPVFCTVHVLDQDRGRQDRGEATVDAGDRRRVDVGLAPLKPGRYRVEWRVLSVDTHVSEGDFTFVVAP